MPVDRIDALLAQKPFGWRLRHSAWIVVVAAGLGIFSFLGWIWAGMMVQSRRFWCVVAVWLVLTTGLWFSSGYDDVPEYASLMENMFGALMFICWIGGTSHALIMRRTVLRAVMKREDALARLVGRDTGLGWGDPLFSGGRTPSEAQWSRSQDLYRAGGGSAASPADLSLGSSDLGIDMSRYYGHHEASAESPADPFKEVSVPGADERRSSRRQVDISTGVVDANAAGASELETIGSLDAEAINRILEARQRLGGFRDLDDLVSAADLQPHQVFRMRERVVFSEFSKNEEARKGGEPSRGSESGKDRGGQRGRLLDL
ncbi:ComEA family DNA-binding protein [Actinomyces lilanjuaniae]|nr:helix-hairpin-helix domain-containing protein [Actinomyces lilanjuaniae]